MAKRIAPLGTLIDTLWGLREGRRAMKAALDENEALIAEQEAQILERLDKEGLEKSTGQAATASISKVQATSLVDYDAFVEYVKKKQYFHLFERRVSQVAAREIWEKDGQLPGCESFTKRKINLRSTTTKE